MDKLIQDFLEQWKEFRSRKFAFLGRFFLKVGISANIITFFSLIFGLLAVYFLFQNYSLFLLFAILHLLADGLDGIIARSSKETKWGKYFDHGVDALVVLLIILKIGLVFDDYYPFLVVGLFLLAQIIYLFSKLTAPIILTRTISLILLFFYLPAVIHFAGIIPVIIYPLAGITSLYSLARQLQWWITRKNA